MATLNDSFLADLDDLSDNEADILEEEDFDAGHMEEDVVSEDLEALNYDDLDNVSKLHKSQQYNDIMQDVELALSMEIDAYRAIVLEDDPEYQLIVDCNALLVKIEEEITKIHNFILHKYRLKFPELESHVHHPIDYARAVKKIGNQTDLTLVDLERTVEACDRALALDSAKKKVLDFLKRRMVYIAPNLSEIVGTAVAAKLMAIAGGLSALSKTSGRMCYYMEQTEKFQSTPYALRKRAYQLMDSKICLAARIDATGRYQRGIHGRDWSEEIRKQIDKWQETPL